MIKYVPIERVRNEETVQNLANVGAARSGAARSVHLYSGKLLDALRRLEGGKWDCHIDLETGYVSFSRDLS